MPQAPPDHFRKKELLRIRRENARLAGKLLDLRSSGSSLSKERLQRGLPKLSNKTVTSRILADPYSHDIVPSKFGLLKFPEGFKKRALQGFQFKKVRPGDQMPSSVHLGKPDLTADQLRQKLEEFQEKKRKTYHIPSTHKQSRSFSKELEQSSQLRKADAAPSKPAPPSLRHPAHAPARAQPPAPAPVHTFLIDQQPLAKLSEAPAHSITVSVQVQADEVPAGLSVGTSLADAVALVDGKCRLVLPEDFDASLETATLLFFSAAGEQVAEMQVSTLDGDYRVVTVSAEGQLTVLAETTRQ